MREEGADIIIVSAHSGAEKDLENTSNENQVRDMIVNTQDIDLVITGHDHSEYITSQVDKNGKEVQIINGGGRSVAKALINVTVEDGKKTLNTLDLSLIKLDSTIVADATVENAMKPYYDEAVEFVNKPLGTVVSVK